MTSRWGDHRPCFIPQTTPTEALEGQRLRVECPVCGARATGYFTKSTVPVCLECEIPMISTKFADC